MQSYFIYFRYEIIDSRYVQDIDAIYIDQAGTYWKKAEIYDYLKQFPKSIQVNIFPYPYLVLVVSVLREKYVRSEVNDTVTDNLLKLPRK